MHTNPQHQQNSNDPGAATAGRGFVAKVGSVGWLVGG